MLERGTPTTVFESFPFTAKWTPPSISTPSTSSRSLFRWENWEALKRADSQVAQAEADYQAAQQDLMERVAQRYFDVLGAQDDLEAQQVALISVNRQLDQAEARYQIGLIAVTDVEEARASHDSTAAAVIAAKRVLGLHAGTAAGNHRRPVRLPGASDRALRDGESGPDQRGPLGRDGAATEFIAGIEPPGRRHCARKCLDRARRPLPVARFGGQRRQALEQPMASTCSPTAVRRAARPWIRTQRSIGMQLTFPIYSGGMVSSQVRQAVYQHRAAKERLERVARQTEHDARDAYLGVLSEISRVKALRRAVESNMTALRATESGYEAGTRTAVDVLQSRQQWVQAQTDYSRSRYDYMMNMHQAAAGGRHSVRTKPAADQRPADGCACTAAADGCPPLQPRLDEREQPRDAAAIRLRRSACPTTPMRRAFLQGQRAAARSTAARSWASATCSAAPRVKQQLRDFPAVEI